MDWYYAEGNRQMGPISEPDLRVLVMNGQIRPDTLVWREGMADWQPYAQVVASGAAVSVTGPVAMRANEAACAECGRVLAQDEMVRFGNLWVCAGCKPVFFQRLQEGAPLLQRGMMQVSESELLQREYRIDVGECLSRAWRIFAANPGLVIGGMLLIGLVAGVFLFVSFLIGLVIPFGNQLLWMLFSGPLVGGVLWFYLRLARNETAGIVDLFDGFRRRFAQLMLTSLIQGLVNLACMIPLFIAALFFGFSMMTMRSEQVAVVIGFVVLFMFLWSLAVAAAVYFATIWTYALILVIDKRYRFWPAMQLSRRFVHKRWWMTFLFFLVAGIIMTAGWFACLVGALVTVPLYMGMKVCLYEDNFRDLAPQPA